MKTLGKFSLLVSSLVVAACGDSDDSGASFVSAAEPPAFNRVLVELDGNQEDMVEVTLRAETIDGLFGGGFTLTYDPAMLELRSAEPASGTDYLAFTTTFGKSTFVAGELMVGFVLSEPDAEVDIAELGFVTIEAGASSIAFAEPGYRAAVTSRRLMNDKGYLLRGVRWFGGEITTRAQEGGQ